MRYPPRPNRTGAREGGDSPWQKSSGFNRLQSRLAASGCIDDILAIQPASPSLRGDASLDFGPTCLPQAGEYFYHGLLRISRMNLKWVTFDVGQPAPASCAEGAARERMPGLA